MAILATLFGTAAANAETGVPTDDQVKAARAVAVELGGKLKSELSTALAAGGPIQALAVCKTAAPALAADLAASSGGKVGRTALKVRNKANAADTFETAVLLRFIEDAAKGADPAGLEHAEIVEVQGRRSIRYMKAIPMVAAPCAACHGSVVSPDVLQAIRELYPADETVGFKPGDIRGAFTIELPLP
ncbi:MAG: DUF3365 domain-containing protein [Deltaproteobacteria bacterium]